MNNEQRTIRGFTLIELMVAVAILAIVLSFAGVIFRVSIDSYRTASANAEIMQKLRAITDQLNSDFKGALQDYGGYLAFNLDKSDIGGVSIDVNSYCIAFLANGDFQSTGQYNGRTMVGNVAAVFYGQPDPNSFGRVLQPKEKILLRRQTILTTDGPLVGSDPKGEYYNKSLSEWRATPPFIPLSEWVRRPLINPNNLQEYLAMYMAKGVDNFTIEWFDGIDNTGKIKWLRLLGTDNISTKAFKFTFTLYDSKGVIKNGRTFTHIAYLD